MLGMRWRVRRTLGTYALMWDEVWTTSKPRSYTFKRERLVGCILGHNRQPRRLEGITREALPLYASLQFAEAISSRPLTLTRRQAAGRWSPALSGGAWRVGG